MGTTGLARLSPATWAVYASRHGQAPVLDSNGAIIDRGWRPVPHLLLVNYYLLEMAARRLRFLMVFMPPRHGKSNLLSQYAPGWWLGTFQDERVILASHTANFAAQWGRKARDALDECGMEVFGIKVDPRTKAADEWDTVSLRGGRLMRTGGGMSAHGVGGAITGRGAHLFIIDDPVKDGKESMSRVVQEAQWDWYRSVALTRLEPRGCMILMMTRWNENDLAGRILQASQPREDGVLQFDDDDSDIIWTVLSLPALAERVEDYPYLHREVGEALWPERRSAEWLLRFKQKIGGYWWSALFQQRPAPQEGNIFKRSWFRYFKVEQQGDETIYVLRRPLSDAHYEEHHVLAKDCWIFQTCDPAATEAERADYFVLATWAVTPDRDLLLLDMLREQADTTKHQEILRTAFERWTPVAQGVEKAAFGLNILQACVKAGLPVKPLPAEGDKVARAKTISSRYEMGTVYHRVDAPWLMEYEDELLVFPSAAHDDQVDVASYAGIELVWTAQFGIGYGMDVGPLKPEEVSLAGG